MKLEKYKQRNPKNIGIAIFTIACVLLIAFVFIYSSFASFQTNETRTFINGNVVDPGDLYFAFYVDGVISSTMPAKGKGYVLDKEKTTCTNGAAVEWLDDEWAPKILNFTQTRTKCTLYFIKEPTAAETILAQGETEELKFDNTEDNNLRYVGANPNNYVTFNNELWRIIGVFNNIDNGSGIKETRIKLIRDESIGKYSWDYDSTGSYNNDWTSSQLKDLLNNGAYYNRTTGSYYNGSTTATSVDFTSNGLTEEAKAMISDAVWNLGGVSDAEHTPATVFYESERYTPIWTGKIGLIYPSDYGYATSGESTTHREACLNAALYRWENDPNYIGCRMTSWLWLWVNDENYGLISGYWTLTKYYVSSSMVYNVGATGSAYYDNVYNTYYDVFPALYLNSNVKITSGEGTESNPFILSL